MRASAVSATPRIQLAQNATVALMAPATWVASAASDTAASQRRW